MTVGVITGGRDRTPTLAELEDLTARALALGATTIRNGKARGTDRAVAAWLRARTDLDVEDWPADWDAHGLGAGPKRNRAMLDGDGVGNLFGESERPPASFVFAFEGGKGTADCCEAALERGIPLDRIPPREEPRIWNRHHGPAPKPFAYVGRSPARSSPLANPNPMELREGETRAGAASANLGLYRAWLWERINPSRWDPVVMRAMEEITADHHLVCSCWPRHCHAEVIVRAWRWMRARE